MTVLDLNNGGMKRKRHPRDDGFRIPIVQPSYFFDGVKPGLQDTIQPAYRTSKNDLGRSASQRTFHASKHESYLPKGPSSARAEFRAISMVKDGRQRASSIHSSRSSVVGREGTEKCDGQTKSSTPTPLSRHFPVTSRSSTTISRSSSSTSLLPAHLRPNAVHQEDSLSAERYASSLRLLATWESIALKYADVDPEDDAEIDIATGRIVKGKEKIAEMPDRVIGGMSDEEEAEEFRRKGKSSVKNAKSTFEALPADVVEHVLPPVLPLTLDSEEVDFSDKDELDAWNDDELEIQVEALPPSHTSRSRHQRPWTADDDVDLREFLKAEERRKAMFGEEEVAEVAGIEDERRSQVGRALDKEEAMSRRTVHASVPYFSTNTPPPVSRTSNRSKKSDALLKTTEFSTRPTSRQPISQATVESEDEASAEDELAEMLETPDRLQDTQLQSRHSAMRQPRNASPLNLDMLDVRNTRPSSPSSASSHLNRQSTEGLSSSGEGESIPRSNMLRRMRQTPDLDEEELCEDQLLHISSQDKDKEHGDDYLSDGDASISHSPVALKLDAWQDEGRCSSNKVVEVVIEVSASVESDLVPAVNEDADRLSANGTGPRRSSRQSAQGKSYALRKKRNRQSRPPREETPSERDDVDAAHVYSTDSVPEASPALPLTDLLLQPELQTLPAVPTMELPTTLRVGDIGMLQSRSRSPSVVEGTPEPPSPGSYADESLEYFGYLHAGIPSATGVLSTADIEAVQERSRKEREPAAEPIHVTCTLDPPLGSLPVQAPVIPSSHNAAERASVDFDDVHTDIAPSISRPECSESANDPPLSLSITSSQDADDEDILLLGATFEDEEEIIWPETKPDVALPTSPPASSEWPNTSCEMSFRSIKGEKQEMTTFTAPFRCSRIIDLTSDDLCDEDEHDELDEW